MRQSLTFFTVFAFILLISCGGGDDDGVTDVDISVFGVQLADVENAGDASDIQLAFKISDNEVRVDHYKAIVVKGSERSTFDLSTAQSLSEASFFRIDKTGSNILTNLSASLADANGDAIEGDQAYYVFVLSEGLSGTESTIKASPSPISLLRTDILEVMLELPIGTGGLVVDAQGNIYCADFGISLSGSAGTLLYKITPSGQASIFASGFVGASGNTIGPDGNIYQSNIGGGKISKVTMDGTVSNYANVPNPVGLVFDKQGNLYATSCGGNAIYKITPNRSASVFVSGSIFNCPNGLTIDDDGNLYAANFGNSNVIKITPDGSTSVFTSLPGSNNGHITFFQDNLYVVAREVNRIYKVSLSGGRSVFVGSGTRGHGEGSALQAELSLPNDLGFSPDGSILYINDTKPLTGTPSTSLLKPTMLKKVRIEKD